jgi:hypothetical protein
MSEQTTELEIVPAETSALQALETASIDQQIATAKKYKRDIPSVKSRIMSMATLDEETAEACFYTLKRKGKDGEQKLIQGPSIRHAEIVASGFGNIRSGSRLLSNDGRFVTCQGVCHDLENNVYFSQEVTRRITNKEGRIFSDDMIAVTINAAQSIALRNAILKTVPAVFHKPAYDAARRIAVGDVKSLSNRRARVIAKLKAMGASQDAILAAVDCSTVDDVTVDKLEMLIGLGTALKDGDTTLEEAFPPVGGKLHSRGAAKPAPTPEAAPPGTPPAQTTPGTEAPATSTAPQSMPASVAGSHFTPQEQLVRIVVEAGFTFEQLIGFLVEGGHMENPVPTPDLIPLDLAERFVNAKAGLLRGMTLNCA